MNKEMNSIRILIIMVALMFGAVNEAWAQLTANDIEYEVKPSASAGTVSPSVSERTVTLSVTPATGYFIKASDFVVEKLVNTGKANAPKRRVSDITNLITGKLYKDDMTAEISSVSAGSTAKYVFTLPAEYDGAYVTATFHLEEEGDIIRITRNTSLGENPNMNKHYVLVEDVSASVVNTFYSAGTFTGIFEGEPKADGSFPKITGLSTPLFNTLTGTVKNIMLEGVGISNHTGNTGAIACTANGAARIYNVGILSGSVGGTGNTGGLVGLLDGTARVINCYSFADITGGSNVAGIVGNNNQTSSQSALKTIVVNCMFYGNITGGTSVYPVYGGKSINNDSNTGINPYCYFRKNATLTPTAYNRSWPAEEKNLTRFEYYRSVLNSNRKLCTWWVNGISGTAPTDEDVANVGIAKWVLDPGVAPYPILKKWGKYPSVINHDPDKVWDPRTEVKEGDVVTPVTPHWVQRSDANEWEGKSYGTLTVTIKAGAHGSGSTSRNIAITDMDTLNCDYSYYKIQLPYYNEVFGNPNGDTHAAKYGGNYTEYVVTGWEITAAGSTTATDYNFADRNSINGRVFAQGGYYYVPKDVTSITITARWGKAIYLSNRGYSIDRVNVTKANYKEDNAFAPAGTVSNTFQGQPVYDDLQNAIKALGTNTDFPTVYDQAIVLIGNHQVKNGNNDVGYNLDSKWHPFTIMSADFDFDNEPDYCLQFQFRDGTPRPGIQPIRFDFLPVVELGLALRHDNMAYAIGIFVPQGHFEVTETAFMRTTQFEYDGFQGYEDNRIEAKSPVIINGGEYEMFVVRYHDSNRTSYFLLGGNAWIHRFAPGAHPSNASPKIYLCPINVIGGQVKELYLTGLYRAELAAPTNQGAPRCYTDGGKFDIMAGAGYEKVEAGSNVTFKINHSKITEFYGGGINATNPISGNINVTIDNSYVDKYCGGPKVGDMTGKTVTTHATGTTFGVFYGGGNGGNSYYRHLQKDGDQNSSHIGTWTDNNYNWNGFKPLEVKDDGTDNKGYHAEYEFEVFNHSNGVTDQITQRGFIRWIQFGITKTGDVSSTLSDCKILGNFYGGGNLATVDGKVTSTLTNTQVDGSVFGAGYSAAIPTFQVHDKSTVSFPSITAGVITDGYIGYDSKVYEWTNEKLEGKDEAYMKAHPTYEKDGKWYCYTWNSLDDLGAVTGTATLTIDGTTTVAHSVYGGGEESAVNGNTSVTVTGGTIGTANEGGAEYGNVYGGGKGSIRDVRHGLVKGNTKVTVENTGTGNDKIVPFIRHNVYGGGAYGSVGTFTYASDAADAAITGYTSGGKAEVIITGGTFGTTGSSNGMIFGSSRGDVGAPGSIHDKLAWVYDTDVKIGTSGSGSVFSTPTIKGSVYGGGENGHVFRNADVYIYSGTVGIPTGQEIDNQSGAAYPYRGNVYGGGCGTDKYYTDLTNVQDPTDGNGNAYNPLAGIVQGNATVTISGGHVVRNVYGAGAMGSVGTASDANSGKTTVTVSGGRIGYDGNSNNDGNIFGAARGDLAATGDLALVRETEVNINYTTTPAADNQGKTEQLIAGSVFGGGEAGKVKGSVAVNMTGGLVLKDVYGGGALADTQTSNWDASANSGVGGWADADKKSALHTTTVRLTGGRIGEEVFGGALGEAGTQQNPTGKPAYVWGDVLVELNNGVADAAKGCVVGKVFGCNNANGTPKGDVVVHVYATQNAAATQIANTGGETPVTNAKRIGYYDVSAVYGGGNEAAYDPVTPNTSTTTVSNGSRTQVIIEGCDRTSINTVYGGGNAAAVPETNVDIKSAYEIYQVFGGGNGKDKKSDGSDNPGADVGTLDQGTSTYGTGIATSLLEGGHIHEAYGGSNQKGIIKGSINQTTNPDGSTCNLNVEKIVGAGKYADIDGDVNMTLSCQPESKVLELFAGADEANVNGNITLNITNGHFGNVFGGNNLGGVIKGKITVNVEETECQPIKIDNLYLGGNQAAYSVYGYYESNETHPVTGKKILKPRESANDSHDPVPNPTTDGHTFPYAQPELNIISCTYIGNVFGGGLGKPAKMYANPTVNVNMVAGRHAATAVPAMMEELHLDPTKTAPNPDNLGIIRNVYGGGDAADIEGNTTVNIAVEYVVKQVNEGANVTGYYTRSGAGTTADPFVYTAATSTAVEGKTYYEKKAAQGSAYIIGSVFGGGNAADVLGNTNVTMSDGYVFNGIFGGGYAGNVGTFTRSSDTQYTNVFGHTAHASKCIGKPISCKAGTGKCTVLVNGGQIGPISVAKDGMTRASGPVPEGWVWGAGQGLVEDPATHPDTHFTSYVGSTDVTIGGTALIMESIIGGGEFGRVLGNTLVKIEGGQIGVGAGKVDANNKPIRYTDDQFVNPLTTPITSGTNGNALAECSHFPYGADTNDDGIKDTFLPYDPYYDKYLAKNPSIATSDFGPASTTSPSDGKTWIGCVFAGGSGYMPYEKEDGSGYDWCSSAGLVEGNTELIISGGHILTNVYGGNEVTNVKGKCKVTMTGGTIGVPRTVQQIIDHPLTCYLFGAGKGDPRPHFNTETNVGEVEINISGGIIYGSVFGGGEDGHVQRDVNLTIEKGEDFTIGGTTYSNGPVIGTWGTTYVDGNVFGGGRGFAGDAYTAGNVAGCVNLDIKGGTILGSVYGGGRLGSVGYGLYPSTEDETKYGAMRPDNTGDDGSKATIPGFKRGYVDVEISGGTIGNTHEYIIPNAGNTPTGLDIDNIASWTDANWKTWKTHNNIPLTEFDKETHRLKHTKGGNVFAGGMGRLYQLDGITPISAVNWWKLGCVKSTKLTVKGGTIKSNVYGGGELGAVKPYVNGTVVQGGTTEVIVQNDNTQIGTEVQDGSNATQYTFGSVYGGGYGSTIENLNGTDDTSTENDNPKFVAGFVYGDTKIDMQGGKVLASVYGGGEVASVNGSADVKVSGGEVGKDKVGNQQFGGPTMGNVYGGGSGNPNIVRCGRILKNTKVTISGTDTKIYHNVYGGGAYGTVGDFNYTTDPDDHKVIGVESLKTAGTGTAEVIITGGTIGTDGHENGMVFGSSRGDINKTGERDDHTAWVYDAKVTIGTSGSDAGPAIKGSIYGSGENGHTFNNAEVTVHSGTIGVTDDASYLYRGNVYGGGCGTDKYWSNTSLETHNGNGDTYNPLAGIVYGNTTVTIDGGTVVRNVYGAGAMGSVGKKDANGAIIGGGKTTINVSGGTIGVSGTVGDGNVYGAARGDLNDDTNGLAEVKNTEVNIKPNAIDGKPEATIKGSVFGGGEAGIVKGAVAVSMTGGNVLHDVYGGGALANTNTDNWGTTTWATGKSSASNITTVNLTGGTVTGNVYGGGLGRMAVGESGQTGYVPAIEAKVYGNTTVELNNGVADYAKGCIVEGSIFGCNNMSGSPQGATTVYIHKTQRKGATRITNTTGVTNAKVKGTKTNGEYNPGSFDVKAVYGGGNMAAFEPVDLTTGTTNVIIDGCERTSICHVYGGGNAASTPATNVTINGTYEIGELFGGGNGKDDIVKNNVTLPNPGANVGYKDYTVYTKDGDDWVARDSVDFDTKEERTASTSGITYGTGVATVNVFGGLVHRVFGGSNTKGNVRQTALTLLDENNDCPFCVDEAYGGGKSAEMDAEAKLLMACIPGLQAAYGGAEAADVRGNVTLNITNGTFQRVFGGNNLSGTIRGSIKVNIKEIGCRPIIIGELYGGGNQAAYSVFGYDSDNKPKESGTPWSDPEVNVTSFTSIGEIYGGGFGEKAVMVGNPKVNINEAIGTPDTYPTTGDFDDTGFKGKTFTIDEGKATEHTVTCPAHKRGKMGVIGKVFGGGNAAQVKGDTNVRIGTTTGTITYEEVDAEVGKTVVTSYYIRTGAGTSESPYTYTDHPSKEAGTCDDNGKAVTGKTYYRKVEIIGADIRGNVYGGGNNAEVTGNTNVNIGKRAE